MHTNKISHKGTKTQRGIAAKGTKGTKGAKTDRRTTNPNSRERAQRTQKKTDEKLTPRRKAPRLLLAGFQGQFYRVLIEKCPY
jgi:hypothetical protein